MLHFRVRWNGRERIELDSVYEKSIDERLPTSRPAFAQSENQVRCLAKTQEPIFAIVVREFENVEVALAAVREIEFRVREVGDNHSVVTDDGLRIPEDVEQLVEVFHMVVLQAEENMFCLLDILVWKHDVLVPQMIKPFDTVLFPYGMREERGIRENESKSTSCSSKRVLFAK